MQVTAKTTVNWKDLCPSVKLAIIGRMSEELPITKVYDMLGIYAHGLGDIKKLAAQYNHQREMEDYLTFWMQQDQLSGILRTDHTSTLRGAPEAYQEFQTQNYLRKIQAEINEDLLQATRAELNLGKRFLGQQGIPPHMIGCWGCVSGSMYAVRPCDRQILPPKLSVPVRHGLDSGYVSASVSPSKPLLEQNIDYALASSAQPHNQIRRRTESRRTSRSKDSKTHEPQKTPAPAEKQCPQQHNRPSALCDPPSSPADDASTNGFSGRSRRNVRHTSRYTEAIVELKLRGSGSEEASEYETSDENDNESAEPGLLITLPRLPTTSNNKITRVSATSPSHTTDPELGAETGETDVDIPGTLSQVSTDLLTTPKRTSSLLPLKRVVVQPPKMTPRPRQSSSVVQPSEELVPKKFNQRLLGMPKEGKDFAESCLKASQRAAAKATPWIPLQPKHIAEATLPSMADQQRQSGTLVPPEVSPITECSPRFSTQEYPLSTAGVYSSAKPWRSRAIDLSTNETMMKSFLPATPASESQYLTRNERSIVTETGSPVPGRNRSMSQATSLTNRGGISSRHGAATENHGKAVNTPHAGTKKACTPTLSEIFYHSLDPVTGNVMTNQPLQQGGNPAALSSQSSPHTFSTHTSLPVTALQEAGEEVQKAAVDLTNVAAKLTSTRILPTNATLLTEVASSGPKRSSSRVSKANNETSSQGDPKGRKKYGKSEAQKQKEGARAEKVELERREKEERLAKKAFEAKAKRAERA